MRIGLYNEPPAASIGGSEYLVSVLAEALREEHTVDILHHRRGLDATTLERYFDVDLAGVTLDYHDRLPMPPARSRLSVLNRHEGRSWRAELSAPYDLFVAVCHSIPPFCHAPHGVLVVLFPLYQRAAAWPWNDPPRHRADLWRIARRAHYEREWHNRLASYQSVISISEFTRTWTKRYWSVDSSVVYPPVAAIGSPGDKRDLILSIGRFTPAGHAKRHPEMIAAFAGLTELREQGWRYESLGALGESAEDLAYFAHVGRLASEAGAVVRANVSRAELTGALREAKVFLHAAGLGVGEDRPDLTEHFGIATVEAMAAGCVPVVVNRGAQPEIVEHGVSGFVWNTPTELQDYVRTLARDEPLRQRMSARAVERSRAFGREHFVSAMRRVLGLSPVTRADAGASSMRGVAASSS